MPASPEQLSNAWLSEVLGQRVTDFAVEPLGAGAGIIGLVTRVHLRGADGLRSVIAKFPSPVPENRAVAANFDMYGREVAFYQSVGSQISLRVPACYHAQIDRDSGDFVLLLEDLGALRVGDQVAGCTAADAHLVIRGIAALHASTWNKPFSGTLICHNNPAQSEGMSAGFRMGWTVIQERFADLLPSGCGALGQRLPDAVPSLLARMCCAPMSVAHADVRLDNVLFDDDAIALVDWQSVCTSAPEQDLAYFVTQSLPADVRRSEDWVAVYYEALRGAGVDYDLATCRSRYRISALYLLCYAVVIAGTLDMGNERGQRLARTLLDNAFRSLEELDAFSLLNPE